MAVYCPICGSPNVEPTTDVGELGLREYHCIDCGEYFVDREQQQPNANNSDEDDNQ